MVPSVAPQGLLCRAAPTSTGFLWTPAMPSCPVVGARGRRLYMYLRGQDGHSQLHGPETLSNGLEVTRPEERGLRLKPLALCAGPPGVLIRPLFSVSRARSSELGALIMERLPWRGSRVPVSTSLCANPPTQGPPLLSLHPQGLLSTLFPGTEGRHQPLGTPCAPEPLELFRLALPKPADPAFLLLPAETSIRAPPFPLPSGPTLELLGVALLVAHGFSNHQ